MPEKKQIYGSANFSIRNPYMKFQDPLVCTVKITGCIKSVTNTGQAKSNMPNRL